MSGKPRTKMKRKKGLSKSQRRDVKEIVDRELDDAIEDKGYVDIIENTQLYHNKPLYSAKLLGLLEQGVNTGTSGTGASGSNKVRIGDEIQLKNINIRFWLSNKLNRPNCMYKGVLFWYPVGILPSDALIYKTQTNKMLDRYDTDNIKILDTFIVQSTNNYAPDYEKSYLATLNKSYKRKKIQYDANGVQPKGWNLGYALVVYDAYGTLQTDNIASVATSLQITFQDA